MVFNIQVIHQSINVYFRILIWQPIDTNCFTMAFGLATIGIYGFTMVLEFGNHWI